MDTIPEILFLSWESPWPAYRGGTLRTLGLLRELSKYYDIEIAIISQAPLSEAQRIEVHKYASAIVEVPMMGKRFLDKLKIFWHMFSRQITYHCAVIELSFANTPRVLEKIRTFPGIVYASYGHWGTLAAGKNARNWILDQHNADIDFWRVYASQSSKLGLKLAALVNWKLSEQHFKKIYKSVGRIVSVCEEDKQVTRIFAPDTIIDVIENGVDCASFSPKPRRSDPEIPRVLFTGTSAPRNMTALHNFTRDAWPLIIAEMPGVELLVGGNFDLKAQAEFAHIRNIRFTGRVDDMRPAFDQSDVFIAPFEDTHGSKLKIAEAMAMAMPIVSTVQGVRGFPLVDGQSVLIAHDDAQFARHVIDLLNNAPMRRNLGLAAREIAEKHLDWSMLGQRLEKIIAEVQKESA